MQLETACATAARNNRIAIGAMALSANGKRL